MVSCKPKRLNDEYCQKFSRDLLQVVPVTQWLQVAAVVMKSLHVELRRRLKVLVLQNSVHGEHRRSASAAMTCHRRSDPEVDHHEVDDPCRGAHADAEALPLVSPSRVASSRAWWCRRSTVCSQSCCKMMTMYFFVVTSVCADSHELINTVYHSAGKLINNIQTMSWTEETDAQWVWLAVVMLFIASFILKILQTSKRTVLIFHWLSVGDVIWNVY